MNDFIIADLARKSIKVDSTPEEFEDGRVPTSILSEHGRKANAMVTSFVNPYLAKMEYFVPWIKYGVDYRDVKGMAYMGTLRNMDVYGVPGMPENQMIAYQRENIGLQISPILIHLETRWRLYLMEEYNLWLTKPNSSVFITLS